MERKRNDKPEQVYTDSNDNTTFVAIPIKSFLSGERVLFDVFVRMHDGHFVHILRKDQPFDPIRLGRYREQNIENLFLRTEDLPNYVESCLTFAKVVHEQDNIVAPHKKLNILAPVAEAVFNEIMIFNVDEKIMQHSMTITHDMVEFLENHRELPAVIESFDKIGEDFIRHAVGVGSLATIIAYSMGWQGYSTLSVLSLAGLFHDIGFKELPPGLWSKPRIDMSPEEVELYESHSERGKHILYGLRSVPAQAISVVAEHHEAIHGKGFPRRLRGDKILPLSRLLSFADLMAYELLKSPLNPNPDHSPESLHRFETIHRHDFTPEFWTVFNKLVAPYVELNEKKAH